MKISLVTDLDCRHRFVGSDGKTFAFPGQDFKPLGGPTNDKKCRGIYVGPDIIDKLKCEPDPPEDFSYSDTSSGVSEPSPSSPISVPPCFCDIRATFIGYNSFGNRLVEIVNFGTCDVILNVIYPPSLIVIPDTNVSLPASGRVVLEVAIIEFGVLADVVIKTDTCGDFVVTFGTIYPTEVP